MDLEPPRLEEVDVVLELELERRVTRGERIEAEPVHDALRLGLPVAVELDADAAREHDDRALATFLEAEAETARYVAVHLGCTFLPADGSTLVRATLAIELARADGRPDELPIAWSLTPLRVERTVPVEQTLKLGSTAQFLEASIEYGRTEERHDVHIEALGLQESRPGWEFSRTRSTELRGTHRLAAVIRIPRQVEALGRVSLTASARGRRFLLIPYTAVLGEREGVEFVL